MPLIEDDEYIEEDSYSKSLPAVKIGMILAFLVALGYGIVVLVPKFFSALACNTDAGNNSAKARAHDRRVDHERSVRNIGLMTANANEGLEALGQLDQALLVSPDAIDFPDHMVKPTYGREMELLEGAQERTGQKNGTQGRFRNGRFETRDPATKQWSASSSLLDDYEISMPGKSRWKIGESG